MLERVWKLWYGHVFCAGMLLYHIFGFMKQCVVVKLIHC